MIPVDLEKRLTMQGFSCSVNPGIPAVQKWLRLTPALSTVWIVLGIIFSSPLFLFGFALVSGFASSRKRHPFDAIYNYGIRKLLHTPAPPLPNNPMPRRFSMALAAVWSALAGMLFLFEFSLPGYVMGSILVVAGAVNVFTQFCLGAWIFHRLFKGDKLM